MYRFLLSPKWLVGHVVVAAVAVVFVSLGLWQLDRHDQRTARNTLVAERIAAPAAALDELSDVAEDELAYRRVTLSGRYLTDGEVLLTPRGYSGRPGHHLLTPLVTDDGDAVLVDRGWVPYELNEPPVTEAAPPEGEIDLSGLVFPDEPGTRFAPPISGEGELATVSRVDVERLQRQIDPPLRPYYVQLQSQEPEGAQLPMPAEPPELTGGNHLSYAVQWFLFAAVGLIGYPVLVRRTAIERRGQREEPSATAPAADRTEVGLTEVP